MLFLKGFIFVFCGLSWQLSWGIDLGTNLNSTTELLLLPKKKESNTNSKSGVSSSSSPKSSERYSQKKAFPTKDSKTHSTDTNMPEKTLPQKKVSSKAVSYSDSSADVNVYLIPEGKKSQLSPSEREDISKSLYGDKIEENPNADLPTRPESELAPVVKAQDSQILLPGADSDKIVEYVEQIHPDDSRLNEAELSVGSGLMTNDSRSNYSYRGYSTSSPYINFMGRFWLSPFLGVYGSYLNSVGGDMTANPADRSQISAQHEFTEFGVDLRKYYGLSRRSNSLSYGIFFNEYRLTVPGDTQYRVKLRSSGFGFQVHARFPTSPVYSWTVGGKVIPRVQANENATGIDMSSGSLGESSRFSLALGGEFKLSRQNQIFWTLEGMVEKNQFNGQANRTDPETGSTPSGVGVENRFLILNFGYRWAQ